jgi:MFS family permease
MEGIFISAGVSLPNWVNFGFFSAWSNSAQWRSTIVLPVVFSFFAMIFLFFMPESPRWLARKGRMDEARAVLAALMDKSTDSHEVNAEMNHIHAQLEATRGSFKLFFKGSNQRYLHRTIIAGIAQSMTQWCGCSALIFYTSTVFSGLGFTGTPVRLLSAGLVTSFTLSACIPLFTVDRVGRRILFMVSAGGMAISMAVLAGTSGKENLAPVSTAFFFLYACFYAQGFLGLPFLYAGEIATIRMRTPIVAVAVTGQWLGQFVVGQITPPGTTNLKNRYWIIYAVLNAVFVPIVYFFFPETSGRSLEEIDDIFQRSNTWNLVRNAASLPKDRDLDVADLEKKYALDPMTPDKESSIDEVENAGV